MKITEKQYNQFIKITKENGGYIGTENYEGACDFFERIKKDYKTASFHTYGDRYYICLNEEGRNNYAMKSIYRILQYEDKAEYYRSLLAEVRKQNERLKTSMKG